MNVLPLWIAILGALIVVGAYTLRAVDQLITVVEGSARQAKLRLRSAIGLVLLALTLVAMPVLYAINPPSALPPDQDGGLVAMMVIYVLTLGGAALFLFFAGLLLALRHRTPTSKKE